MRFLVGLFMHHLKFAEVSRLGERFCPTGTFLRFLSGMRTFVRYEARSTSKFFSTVIAAVRLFSSMNVFVLTQVT